MTESEFVQWLRGFVEGVHQYNMTPKQFDHLKDTLSKVKKDKHEYNLKDLENQGYTTDIDHNMSFFKDTTNKEVNNSLYG